MSLHSPIIMSTHQLFPIPRYSICNNRLSFSSRDSTYAVIENGIAFSLGTPAVAGEALPHAPASGFTEPLADEVHITFLPCDPEKKVTSSKVRWRLTVLVAGFLSPEVSSITSVVRRLFSPTSTSSRYTMGSEVVIESKVSGGAQEYGNEVARSPHS